MTSKTKLIKHLQKDIYCRIGVSKISGVGVIAIKDIPKGIYPFVSLSKEKEKIIELNDNDLKHVDKNVKKLINDLFGGEDGKYDVLYYGTNHVDISYYLNHSNHPNLDIIDNKSSKYLTFKTNRKIKKGEELTINYKKYED